MHIIDSAGSVFIFFSLCGFFVLSHPVKGNAVFCWVCEVFFHLLFPLLFYFCMYVYCSVQPGKR